MESSQPSEHCSERTFTMKHYSVTLCPTIINGNFPLGKVRLEEANKKSATAKLLKLKCTGFQFQGCVTTIIGPSDLLLADTAK